jgi:hypothetical protein
MAECIEHSLDELEHVISQAGPALDIAGQTKIEEVRREANDPLKAFHDASRALDEAIESLGD